MADSNAECVHFAPTPRRAPAVIVLGPHLEAVSGVSAHLEGLFGSRLTETFRLIHFRVGREGDRQGPVAHLLRLLAGPLVLAAAILRHDARVVHVNTSLNARAFWRDLVYVAAAKLAGARVLYQVHGGALPQELFPRGRWLTALLRGALARVDAIVLLARAELDAYRRFVPDQRILIIPNSIDCARWAGCLRAPPDHSAPLDLVYFGRLAREKGVHELVQGLALALGRGALARLTIAGSGRENASLRRAVRKLGLGGRVAFRGPLFGADKVRLLSSTDVLALPSYAEGLPYALLEAMAAGNAVIATPVGAIPDVLSDGVHGVLVPPRDVQSIADAIVRLDAQRHVLRRMRAACRLRVASAYSLERMADAFAALYAELSAAAVVQIAARR